MPVDGRMVWDEEQLGERVLEWALRSPRIPMSEARAGRRGVGGPGGYAIFLASDDAAGSAGGARLSRYGTIATGVTPAYVGAASDLGARQARHVLSLTFAEDVEVEDAWWLALPTPSVGAALHTEHLLRVALRPVWCDAVTGLGGMRKGAGRQGQRASLWDSLHPGRPWAPRPSALERARAAAALLRHLSSGVTPMWPPLGG
jgi:hypothetical protein